MVAQKQAESLDALGHDVTVFTCAHVHASTSSSFGKVTVYALQANNFFDTHFAIPFPICGLNFYKKLERSITESDLVHIHDVFYMSSWFAFFAAKKHKKPLVLTQHVGVVRHTNIVVMLVQKIVYGTIGQMIFKGADQIVVYNPMVENFLLDRGIACEKISRLENGVDLSVFNNAKNIDIQATKRKYGLPTDRKIVLFVGRFVPKKGLHLMAEAFDASYDLTLVGEGSVPKQLVDHTHVHHLGKRSHEELAELYQVADLFVFPAVGEVFTLVMQEALASGAPVLATDEVGYEAYKINRDLLRFCEPTSSAFKQNITQILSDEKLQTRMRSYALELAHSFFDWNTNILRLENTYQEVLNKPKTILITAPHFPPHTGGLERYAKEIADHLSLDDKLQIVILTTGEQGQCDTIRTEGKLTVHRLGYDLKISNTPIAIRWFWVIRKFLKETKPDIINVHSPVPGIGDITALFSRTEQLLVTYHLGSMRKGSFIPDCVIWIYEYIFLPRMLCKARRIIVASETVREDFLSAYKHKSTVISPGVDSDFFNPEPNQKADRPTILFVANLDSATRKGLDTMLHSLVEVKKYVPDVQLIVVGDGSEKIRYVNMAATLNLGDSVHFTGALSGTNLRDVYRSAHVFCLPTKNDSFGMVIAEAMSSGLPVVVSNVGDIPRFVKNNTSGFVLEPSDSAGFAQKLTDILVEPTLQRNMGGAGRNFVTENLDWSLKFKQYRTVVDEYFMAPHKTIVHVSAYFPPALGGIERMVKTTVDHLANEGVSTIALTSKNKNIKTSAELRAVRSFGIARVPFAPMLLPQLLLLPKNSLVHFHLAHAYWPECLFIASWLRKLPYIVHFHLDVESSGIFGFLFTLHKTIIWKPLLRRAERVVVCSPEQIQILTKKYDVTEEKIIVIPNAVDQVFFDQPRYTPPESGLSLLYVGRLSAQKRLDILIDAVATTEDISLTIVGDGELRTNLEKKVDNLKLRNVLFLGKKSKTELLKEYPKHDAFVITSEKEGLPLAVLEAMAAGLPVVATSVIGLQYLVDGTGELVEAPYTENLIKTFQKLKENPEQLAETSRKSVNRAKLFSWENYFEKLTDLYRALEV